MPSAGTYPANRVVFNGINQSYGISCLRTRHQAHHHVIGSRRIQLPQGDLPRWAGL